MSDTYEKLVALLDASAAVEPSKTLSCRWAAYGLERVVTWTHPCEHHGFARIIKAILHPPCRIAGAGDVLDRDRLSRRTMPKAEAKETKMIGFPNESAEYRAARDRLLEKEIGLRRAMEEVAAARRALPQGGAMPQDYVFDGAGADGQPRKVKFSELFLPGRDTLIVYSMMFPRHKSDTRAQPSTAPFAEMPREETPCPSCTALLDQLDPAVKHLVPAGFNFAVIAKTPIERLAAFAKERGWKNMRLLSSAHNSFNHDYNAEFEDGEQAPMVSVFRREPDGIRHFWSSELLFAKSDPGQDPRAAGTLEPLWNLMDLTPEGRPEWDEQVEYKGSPE